MLSSRAGGVKVQLETLQWTKDAKSTDTKTTKVEAVGKEK